MVAWIGQFLVNDIQAFLSLARSMLTFLPFRSLLITSFHVFLGRPLGKLPLIFRVLHKPDHTFCCFLSRWQNHCSLLSHKHSLMLFTFSPVVTSYAEIQSSGQTFIHLTILELFFIWLSVQLSQSVIILRDWAFSSVLGQSSTTTLGWFAHVWLLNLLSSFSLFQIALYLLYT